MQKYPSLKATFNYDNIKRDVIGITIEDTTDTIIGLEVRRAGKFSNKIKRYSRHKISDWRESDDN